jgi:YesN/AraC family two-component response regulator
VQLKDLKELTEELDVLYIEDDMFLREQNGELLSQLFGRVVVTDDGFKALTIFKNRDFDLVITDINIPTINGINLIKKMKEINTSQSFIITTVYTESELCESIKELEIESFLTKPIQTKELLFEIEKTVNKLCEVTCT